jgi:raffinose/stachyose/melibiose transport system substrate-binding protein
MRGPIDDLACLTATNRKEVVMVFAKSSSGPRNQGTSSSIHTMGTNRGVQAGLAATVISALIVSPTLLAATPASASATTLHILEWENAPSVAATQAIDTAFEKANPGVNVVLSSASSQTSAWNTLVTSSLEAKDVDVLAQFSTVPALAPPTSTHIPASGTLALQQSGQLVNLAGQPFLKLYGIPFQEFANGINGKIYGLDVSEYSEIGNLIVKTAILNKFHLSYPTTYNQLLQECATLKSHGITPFFISAQGAETFVYDGILEQYLMAGQPSSASTAVTLKLYKQFYNATLNWNSAIFVKVAKEFSTLMQYAEPGATGIGQNASYADWAAVSNNYPFLAVGTYGIPSALQANPKLQLGDFALPGTNNPADNRMTVKPDLSWTIPTSSSHIALAEKWLAFFSEPANYSMWLKETGGFSLEPGLNNTSSVLSWENAHLATGEYQSTTFDPWAPAGAPPDAAGPIGYFSPTLVNMAPLGSETITTALDQAAIDYSKVLKSIK